MKIITDEKRINEILTRGVHDVFGREELKIVKESGGLAIGVVNIVGSTLARDVGFGIYNHSGPEIAVATTKAFTSQVAAMVIFGLMMAQAKGVGMQDLDTYIRALESLPGEIEKVLEKLATVNPTYYFRVSIRTNPKKTT